MRLWSQSMEGMGWECGAEIEFGEDSAAWRVRWSVGGSVLGISWSRGENSYIDWFKEGLDGKWEKVTENGEKFFDE